MHIKQFGGKKEKKSRITQTHRKSRKLASRRMENGVRNKIKIKNRGYKRFKRLVEYIMVYLLTNSRTTT